MNKYILILFSCFVCSLSFSQQNVIASGANSESSTGKVTYSVGLIHFKEATGSNGSSSVGSQIPYEILETLSLDEQNLVSLKLFPNPTSNYLFINSKNESSFNYSILNFNGKEIVNGQTCGLQTKIDLSNLNTAIYVLNIYKGNTLFESYKIIKK